MSGSRRGGGRMEWVSLVVVCMLLAPQAQAGFDGFEQDLGFDEDLTFPDPDLDLSVNVDLGSARVRGRSTRQGRPGRAGRAGRVELLSGVGSFEVSSSGLSFSVAGSGDFPEISSPDDVKRLDFRPEGDWPYVFEGRVSHIPEFVWETAKNVGAVLHYAFEELAIGVDPVTEDQEEWRVRLTNRERIFIELVETSEDGLYHVMNFVSHTDGVFPGYSASDTKFYFLVYPGDKDGSSIVEVGWEGGPGGDGDLSVESLFQEMISNLEGKFGQTCELFRNVRSIEGDCNNLRKGRQGAANHPLKRLAKHDPSYTDGVGAPSGALHVSPRTISNEICAQSPGSGHLEKQLEGYQGECFTSQSGEWEVCPFANAVGGIDEEYDMEYNEMVPRDDGSVDMRYEDDDGCSLDVKFACGGDEKLVMDSLGDLAGSGCKHYGWMYSPKACSRESGDDESGVSKAGLTDLFWTMGQFIDHDLDLTPTTQLAEKDQPGFSSLRGSDDELPISVPEDDFFFKEELNFERATVFTGLQESAARRTHLNQHSAYLDLGQVYGVDFLRANTLRTFKNGKLKMGDNGMLPKNKLAGSGALNARVSNAPDAGARFQVAGDIRANEQTLLLSMHILWAREHNLVCDELAAEFPGWGDERLYQTARTVVISEYQSIVYNEWLPKLLGEGVVPATSYVYSSSTDPSVQAFFSTAAFRFGHSMVGSTIWQMDASKSHKALPLRDVFFNPELVENNGIDPFLRGGAWHKCKELDEKIVDELRNFLFNEGKDDRKHDLVSLNIQRGRDMGLPSFNDARDAYGMRTYSSFSEISSDEFKWRALERTYGDIDSVDGFVGGLCEDKVEGSQLGSLFHNSIQDQFTRMRDGDRFFYKGVKWTSKISSAYPWVTKVHNDGVRMADIIARNTDVTKSEMGDKDSVFCVF